MPDYSKGKIYQIKNLLDDEVYVGSTCHTLGKRMADHRYVSKHKEKNIKLHQKMRELGCEHFFIELIENYPCSNKVELLARECFYIKELKSINHDMPGRTKQQWEEDNKDYRKFKKGQWREKNRDHVRDYQRQRDEKKCLCECGLYYSCSNRTRHLRSNQHKQQEEKLNDASFVKCECGAVVFASGLSRHMQLGKHKMLMELNSKPPGS